MSLGEKFSSALFIHFFRSPHDTIQIRLQSQDELWRSGILLNKYEDSYDCFNSICSEEGFLTLWKGNSVYVIRYSASQIIAMFLKEPINKLKLTNTSIDKKKNGLKHYYEKAILEVIPTIIPLAFVYPLDVTKILLINDLNGKYANGLACLKNVFQIHGFKGIYTGFMITVAGAILYRAIYFKLYEAGNSVLIERNLTHQFKWVKSIIWGAFVTILSSVACYPLDTIRKRMITSLFNEKPYNCASECTRSIWNNEGLKGFFTGVGVSIIAGIISTGALIVYDNCFSNSKGRKRK